LFLEQPQALQRQSRQHGALGMHALPGCWHLCWLARLPGCMHPFTVTASNVLLVCLRLHAIPDEWRKKYDDALAPGAGKR